MLFEGQDRRELEKLKKSHGLLPPGQSLTLKWPVLHYGSVPRFDPETWNFRVYGGVDSPLLLSWKDFNALPKIQRSSDFHSVSRWRASTLNRERHTSWCTRNKDSPQTCL